MAAEYQDRFPSPFDIQAPPGCEGWQKMYPYYYTFSDARREYEERQFWFQDALHHAEAMCPADTITPEGWMIGLGQAASRVFLIPPAMGIDQRVLNGYCYITPVAVTDPKLIEERAGHFMKRAGYYFQNWDKLYEKWEGKVTDLIHEMEGIEFKDLPEMEDESMVYGSSGISMGYKLLEGYSRIISLEYKCWQYEFEFLNLTYGCYLTFVEYCNKAFPGIGIQTVAKMVSGIDVILFRPDEELKRLARLALQLGVAEAIMRVHDPVELAEKLSETEGGRRWVEEWERAKYPWFNFSTAMALYHHQPSWIDDLTIPLASLRGYIEKLERGEGIERPVEKIREERERISEEYLNLLKTPEDKQSFQQLLGLARTVFPYAENHQFYLEHWLHTVFWNKMRDLGRIFAKHGFVNDADDFWYLNRFELYEALYDLVSAWATGTEPRGPSYWPPEVEWRKSVLQKFREWSPPPALGVPPDVVAEPFTVMLWGVTTDSVKAWLAPRPKAGEMGDLKGCPASPGVVEGTARVIMTAEELDKVQNGEILVCPITYPSWAAVFIKIKAAVTDLGGMMSHAAIVSREYGLPAVAGTGFATRTIRTGQRIRVDGNSGTVTILQ